MRDRLAMVLHLSSGTLVFAGYLALASVLQYGLGLLLLPLILLPMAPVGGWMEKRFYAWRVLRRVVAIIYMCFIPFSVSMLGLMDAVIALVIFIQSYLLLGEKSVRIYYEIYLMAFFLLLAAVVQAPEPLIAIALLLFGVSAVWGFTALRMYSEKLQNPARGFPEMRPINAAATTAIRPGNIFDFGLMLSLTVLSLLTIMLTVLVFLFTPRVEAGWLGRRDARQAITGLSETVRLTGGANIAEDQTVVMHVRFPEEPAGVLTPAGDLYWRVTTLSRFSGDEWSRRGLNDHYETGVDQVFGTAGQFARHSEALEAGRRQRESSRSVQQIVYMDDVPDQGIPVLDLAQGIKVLGEPVNTQVFWDGFNDFTLQLQTSGSRRLQYEAYTEVRPRDENLLRQIPLDYQAMDSRDYSLLTYHELLPETQQLAKELTASQTSIYDKVIAINDYLGSDVFAYSLQVPALPDQNGIDAFVNQIRRGHCELFASALALMTRSIGIPARVVSGYRGGEYLPGEQAYLVRASMSHLWVEVLFPGYGWVRFDPSPRSDMEATGFRRIQMVWSLYLLRAKMFWFQEVVGFQGSIRLGDLKWPWGDKKRIRPITLPQQQGDDEEETLPRSYAEMLQHPLVQVTAFAACFASSVFVWRRWRRSRAAVVRLTRDQQRMRKLYLRFLRNLSALGVDCSNKTAGEVRSELMQIGLTETSVLDEFITLYNAVRFGGRPLSKEQQQTFKQHLRRLRSRTL